MRSARSPWNSYRQVAVQTAAPGQIVLMLFEGAIRFLDRAETGFGLDDPAEANQTINNNIQRAQEIIRELNMALDLQNGGELARTLRALYHYMDRRLFESNLRKKEDGLRESRGHLSQLREAWATMLQAHACRNDAPSSLSTAA
jgi:flagellar secretion chaperone FliS